MRAALSGGFGAEVVLKRTGNPKFRVKIHDVSTHGCRVEFIDRPRLDEKVWLKFDGLEALSANVCWVEGPDAGVEFERPIHPAVFDLLLKRLDP